jgi:hypothetical protein
MQFQTSILDHWDEPASMIISPIQEPAFSAFLSLSQPFRLMLLDSSSSDLI